MARLLEMGPVTVPATEAMALVETLATSDLGHVECPDELRIQAAAEPSQPVVRITRPTSPTRRAHSPRSSADRLEVKLAFTDGDHGSHFITLN